MKFHSSVKSLSLCSSGSGENKSVALAVSEVKPPPPPEWEVRSRSILVKSGRPPRRGTFLRVQRITETLATHTLSSWPASAISVSLQLTAHIVCRISSGGTSPTGPQRDLTATGPDANPAQHVLYRQTKWLLMIIQVSHIPAGERLELHSKEHLSGGAEECGAWVAKTDQEPFFFFSSVVLQEIHDFHIKSQLIIMRSTTYCCMMTKLQIIFTFYEDISVLYTTTSKWRFLIYINISGASQQEIMQRSPKQQRKITKMAANSSPSSISEGPRS